MHKLLKLSVSLSLFIVGFVLLVVSHTAFAQGPLAVSKVYMPKLPPVSRTAAIYMTLENQGEKAVEVVGVETEAAHHAMIHQTIEKDGMAKMAHMDSILIPAKGTIEFKPGSYHIMLMGLNKEKLAKSFELKLIFADQTTMNIMVIPEK